jgi:hypothetical protein
MERVFWNARRMLWGLALPVFDFLSCSLAKRRCYPFGMTKEQQLIYDWIGTLLVVVPNWDKRLPEMYDSLNKSFFSNSLPPISSDFVCEFCEMPRETGGIYLDAKRAAALSKDGVNVRPGIRINANLRCLTDHVKIALLHEMVHVTGIEKHEKPFKNAIAALFLAGAYKGVL